MDQQQHPSIISTSKPLSSYELRWIDIMDTLEHDLNGTTALPTEESRQRYSKLISETENLVLKNKNKFPGTTIENRSLLSRKFVGDLLCDFTPLKAEVGGFAPMYSQIVFGLLFDQILKDISHANVDFHVLCQGWGYSSHDSWWKLTDPNTYDIPYWHKRTVDLCLESNDFRKIPNPNTLSEGKHIRTIVWLCSFGHAFAVGWNFQKKSDVVSGHFFYIDCNHYNQFALNITREFSNRLRDKFVIQGNLIVQPKSMVLRKEVSATPEFSCVPFMARSTMYISLIDELYSSTDIKNMVDGTAEGGNAEMEFSSKVYYQFEKMLLETAEEIITNQKKLLLLPLYFSSHQFVSINRVFLMAHDIETNSEYSYRFGGFRRGFVVGTKCDGTSDCSLQSRFPSLLPDPSTTSPLLSAIHECRLLINKILKRC